jgi:hypothetical protein
MKILKHFRLIEAGFGTGIANNKSIFRIKNQEK